MAALGDPTPAEAKVESARADAERRAATADQMRAAAEAKEAIERANPGDRPMINLQPSAGHRRRRERHRRLPASGPVIVSGAYGTAIGSQATNGANSSVVRSQAVQGDHNAIAGRDATNTGAQEQPAKEGWWAQLRKRGMVVAFIIIIIGVADVAVFACIGWTPWS